MFLLLTAVAAWALLRPRRLRRTLAPPEGPAGLPGVAAGSAALRSGTGAGVLVSSASPGAAPPQMTQRAAKPSRRHAVIRRLRSCRSHHRRAASLANRTRRMHLAFAAEAVGRHRAERRGLSWINAPSGDERLCR